MAGKTIWVVQSVVMYEGSDDLVAFDTEKAAAAFVAECKAWGERNGRKWDITEPHPAMHYGVALPSSMAYVDYYTATPVWFVG